MPVRIAGLLLLCLPVMLAQTAQITGRVVDQSGAIIQNANVTVLNIERSQRRSALTNEYGYYTIPLLPPGVYEIDILKRGFEPALQTDLPLSVNEIARLDFTLSIAGIREAITVNAQSPLLDHETPTLGGVIGGRQVLELPLLGRNPYAQ